MDSVEVRVAKGQSALRAIALALAISCPGLARAGALYIYEMSNTTEVGYGGAGMTGRANDAGTVFTNPAGMTRFEDSELLAGGTLVYIYAPFQPNRQATTVEGKGRGVKEFIPAASAAYVHPMSDRLKVGVSLQNSFGLTLNWTDNWVGRYTTVGATLIAPQLQPTVAYKINDWLSVGAGAGLTLGYLSEKMRVDPRNPEKPDGKLRVSDAEFAVQGNLGVMIQPTDRTRVGLRYLTETDLDFKDGARVSGVGLHSNPPRHRDFRDSANGLDLGITMPQSVIGGIHHQLDDEWAVLGSVGWEEWSAFGRVQVGLDETGVTTTLDEDFRDVWHFGLGAEYDYHPKWTMTMGVSYDTALGTDRTTSMVLPVSAMYRYAIGFKYKSREDLTLGGGLSWLYQGNTSVKPTGGVEGNYENVNITFLSLYARWH